MSNDYPESFERFWNAWPGPKTPGYGAYTRKTDKSACFKIWQAKGCDKILEVIVSNVEKRAKYDLSWKKNDGEFLSAPAVYLRNKRWEAEWVDVRDKAKSRSEFRHSTAVNPNDLAKYVVDHVPLSDNQKHMMWQFIQSQEGSISGLIVPGDPETGAEGFRFMASEMLSEPV